MLLFIIILGIHGTENRNSNENKNKIDEDPIHKVVTEELANIYSKAEENSQKRCPICFEDMEGDRRPVSTVCKHLFCQICAEWMKAHSKQCPLCNNKYFLASHFPSAICNGKLREANRIIEYDPSSVNQMDRHGNTPLMNASRLGMQSLAKSLIQEANAPENRHNTKLKQAVQHFQNSERHENPTEHENIVKFLLEKNANVDQKDANGETPLMSASMCGRHRDVKLLLEANANVNVENHQGCTALLLTIMVIKVSANPIGHEFIVKLLLEKNANVKQVYDGFTLLEYAIMAENEIVVQYIIQHDPSSVHQTCSTNYTPLLIATWLGHESIVKLLLDANANVNAEDDNRRTPLFKAIKAITELKSSENPTPYENIIKLLLNANANVNAENDDRKTPLFKAIEAIIKLKPSENPTPYENIIRLLLEKMQILSIKLCCQAVSLRLCSCKR
jgi:ankyrin repeat protein